MRLIERSDDALECKLRGKVAQIQPTNDRRTNEQTFALRQRHTYLSREKKASEETRGMHRHPFATPLFK